MPKVSIIGHSNVPKQFYYPGVEVRLFRKPGALLEKFYSYPTFMEIFNYMHDLCFLFLGSNDVKSGGGTDDIPKWTKRVADDIERRTGAEVIVILLEPRQCPPDYHTTTQEYNKIVGSVNKKIQKLRRGRRHLHFWGLPKFHNDRRGYHFDERGTWFISDRIGRQINRFLERNGIRV